MADTNTPIVLVVDDEPELAELYASMLESEYDVRTATGGRQALELVDASVDVVLLDRRMPELSGDEVLAEMRDRGITACVAMLTAVEPEGEIVDMPFEDYKVKPVDRNDVRGLVETLLQRADYDERSQEFFSLASKKAALELAGNDTGEEYDRLVRRMQELRAELDETLDELSDEVVFSAFNDPE